MCSLSTLWKIVIRLRYINIALIFMQKFIPGQDVDVWVKFVESKTFKLSLQMFQPEGITAQDYVVCVCVCVCVYEKIYWYKWQARLLPVP